MLIMIRGTMGSGKSHIVKQVIEDLDRNEQILENLQGKRWCIGHHFPKQDLFVVGHYNHSTWSGADKFWGIAECLKNPKEEVCTLLKRSVQKYGLVLFEGAHTYAWTKEIVELSKFTDVLIIHLTTPLEVCIDSLKKRRAGARRSTKPVTDKFTVHVEARWRSSYHSSAKLLGEGVDVEYLDRDEALKRVRSLVKRP